MQTSHTKVFATLLLLIILLPSSAFALNTGSPAIRAEPAMELWAHQPAVFRVEAENAASVTLHIKGAG